MAVSPGQTEFVDDLFAELGHVTSRAMMGGRTYYCDGNIFAIIGSSGQIYIKATGDLATEMEAAGASIFSMTRKDGSKGSMGYWTLPEAALDDPSEACEWARKSLRANH